MLCYASSAGPGNGGPERSLIQRVWLVNLQELLLHGCIEIDCKRDFWLEVGGQPRITKVHVLSDHGDALASWLALEGPLSVRACSDAGSSTAEKKGRVLGSL